MSKACPWGCASWGYVLKYEVGELWLCQLDDGESLDHSSSITVLSAEDWAVMKMMINMAVS